MSDVPDRMRAGFVRDAREILEEAMRLCGRAESLREDMVRLDVGLAVAPDGHTLELFRRRGSDGSMTLAIDRFCAAALGLGQATWAWTQTINVEVMSDPAGFERRPGPVNDGRDVLPA